MAGLGDQPLRHTGGPPVVSDHRPRERRPSPVNHLDAFDVCGELPAPGITVLEASAGTGKTFTITALVTRFVAQGVPLGNILAVTFTRMATGELRDRVRRQLVNTEDHLARHLLAGEAIPAHDEITAHLVREGGRTIDAM